MSIIAGISVFEHVHISYFERMRTSNNFKFILANRLPKNGKIIMKIKKVQFKFDTVDKNINKFQGSLIHFIKFLWDLSTLFHTQDV